MKHLVLSLAVAAIAGLPAKATLPFYSPDYTFDSTTGTGYAFYSGYGPNIDVSPDGTAASTIISVESNVEVNDFIVGWRGQTPLPTPQLDSLHPNSNVWAINRSGWTCGITIPMPSFVQPALWKPDGSRVDLPLLPGPMDEIEGWAWPAPQNPPHPL